MFVWRYALIAFLLSGCGSGASADFVCSVPSESGETEEHSRLPLICGDTCDLGDQLANEEEESCRREFGEDCICAFELSDACESWLRNRQCND